MSLAPVTVSSSKAILSTDQERSEVESLPKSLETTHPIVIELTSSIVWAILCGDGVDETICEKGCKDLSIIPPKMVFKRLNHTNSKTAVPLPTSESSSLPSSPSLPDEEIPSSAESTSMAPIKKGHGQHKRPLKI